MKLEWDEIGKREYETGVSNVVLFPSNASGGYSKGVAWSGVTQIDESPSGAEPTPMYADNNEYLNLMSAEKHSGTINAYMYPDEFGECDGSANLAEGIKIGQQIRKSFGLAYTTLKGNDTAGTDYGYIIHLVYGAKSSPSSKSHASVNESPEAMTMSWTYNSTPVKVPGKKPTATLTIDSTEVSPSVLKAIEDVLYGTADREPSLPLPSEIIEIARGASTSQPA